MYKIPANTVFMGKKIISMPVCESTNSLMLSMVQSGWLEEGTVIIAESQSGGRGQAGNRWISEPGLNLTFSVLLRPGFLEPVQQFYLNIAAGLAVHDTILEVIGHEVNIKWPNDIMIQGEKVCGILIENQLQGQQFSQTVVGIGLNVNQKKFEWTNATSLSLYSGVDFEKAIVLDTVLVKLENRYEQLRSKSFKRLKDDYYSVLFWKDEEHEFKAEEKIFSGIIQGIDEVGRLQVMVDGKISVYNFKEISFLK